ncbi:MAG: IscS subfamily cysteine desulfurase, partial [Gammaproteobacteria bacterium]|nr:IscS subfamily cysteine desulfurase [Gammaproteobacteria bacterium]
MSSSPKKSSTSDDCRHNKTIYLDYAATTPVDPRVAEKMMHCLTLDGCFANPASSSHHLGRQARGKIEMARRQVASLINAQAEDIIWTSGATESDNLALKGVAYYHTEIDHNNKQAIKRKHIVTCRTEHKAVLDTCKYLESEGYAVTYLKPECNGRVCLQQFREALREDTVLVSIMHVNNEIGVIQDIEAIAEICQTRGIVFHVDAAQSAGKIVLDVEKIPVDLLSFSAHKIYGPKGIGALYVRAAQRVQVEPLIHGGGHEAGLRSGTLATHQIVGMGEAFALARQELENDNQHILKLRQKLLHGIKALGGVTINGFENCFDEQGKPQQLPGILNVSFEGIEGESLLYALCELAVSSGSACTSASAEPSYVLRALGRDDQSAQSSIRFSIGRFTTDADIERAIE